MAAKYALTVAAGPLTRGPAASLALTGLAGLVAPAEVAGAEAASPCGLATAVETGGSGLRPADDDQAPAAGLDD
jgi:hypothetical protein